VRLISICEDPVKVLTAVNAGFAATIHWSSCLPRTPHGIGSERLGWYYKISSFKVRQQFMNDLLREQGITLAEHYQPSRYSEKKIYNHRLIKSLFGETRVTYGLSKPRWSDKPEALAHFTAIYEKGLAEFGVVLHGQGLDAAKAKKREQKAMGMW
jgi:hypothetical protein